MTAPVPTIPGFGPDDPEYGPARRATLRAYVREHEGRFTDEALARAAESAGYTPWEISAAFDSPGPPSAPAAETFLVAIAYVVGVAVLFALLVRSLGLVPTAALAGAAGVIGALALRQRRPAAAQGLACGVIFVIVAPAVLLLGVLGFCLVTGFRIL